MDRVVLKGRRDGVTIMVDPSVGFSVLVDELGRKLSSGAGFWGGAQFFMGEIVSNASPEEKKALEQTLEEFGIIVTERTAVEKRQPAFREDSRDGQSPNNAVMIKRTLRSGQKIEAPGGVVILGDVNAGAEVVAGGDIVVLGSLRGLAHAGAKGDTNAVVMAFRLEPTQLRIAHYISRAPDEGVAPSGPEVARVKNERITVERFGG